MRVVPRAAESLLLERSLPLVDAARQAQMWDGTALMHYAAQGFFLLAYSMHNACGMSKRLACPPNSSNEYRLSDQVAMYGCLTSQVVHIVQSQLPALQQEGAHAPLHSRQEDIGYGVAVCPGYLHGFPHAVCPALGNERFGFWLITDGGASLLQRSKSGSVLSQ